MSDLVIPTLASAPASSIKKKPAVKATVIDSTLGGDKPSFGDVPMECITASKTNPRKIFDDAALADLAASIGKHGVAQPILLRPTHVDAGITYFEVVAGERRFRASKLAGKTTVPAIVRNLSDAEALEIQVIENLQRQDLHPLEEAEGFEVLMRENGYTAEVMAEKTGKSKAYIRIKEVAASQYQKIISGAEAKKLMPNSYSQLGGGYVDLDRPNYADPEHRTYREILGADAPVPKLLDNPHKKRNHRNRQGHRYRSATERAWRQNQCGDRPRIRK